MLQVIEVPGYTTEEKVEIAKRHLLPKQLDLHGLSPSHLQLPSTALALIGTHSTHFHFNTQWTHSRGPLDPAVKDRPWH